MAVDFPGIGTIKIEFGLILRTLENHFKVSINDEGNLELVLSTEDMTDGQ